MNPIEKWGFSYCKKFVYQRVYKFLLCGCWLLLDWIFSGGGTKLWKDIPEPSTSAAGGPATLP